MGQGAPPPRQRCQTLRSHPPALQWPSQGCGSALQPAYRYDPKRSVVDNINLGPTLLSRFDLIYLILDKPDGRTDRQLASHLVSLYQWNHAPAPAAIDQAKLMSYISLARKEVHPKLSDGAWFHW